MLLFGTVCVSCEKNIWKHFKSAPVYTGFSLVSYWGKELSCGHLKIIFIKASTELCHQGNLDYNLKALT